MRSVALKEAFEKRNKGIDERLELIGELYADKQIDPDRYKRLRADLITKRRSHVTFRDMATSEKVEAIIAEASKKFKVKTTFIDKIWRG